MGKFFLSYDLRKVRDYSSLYSGIKSYPTCMQVLESLWYVESSMSASQIRDDLQRYMDKDDGIIVIRYGDSAAWAMLNCDSDKLKSELES